MLNRTKIASLANRICALMLLAALSAVAHAAPIGYVQSTGGITVQPAGNKAPVRITGDNYTVFANDRIDTRNGSAVITLNGGGTIGLGRGSIAVIGDQVGARGLTVSLDRGSVTYSVPSDSGALDIQVDGVTFAATTTAPAGGELSGILQVNENRQVDAFARAGDIAVKQAQSFAGRPAGSQATSAASSATMSTQAYDTLTNVSQGNSVRVQAAPDASSSSVAVVTTAVAQPVSATASSEIALVGGAQGTTMVVSDKKDDQGIQSVSP